MTILNAVYIIKFDKANLFRIPAQTLKRKKNSKFCEYAPILSPVLNTRKTLEIFEPENETTTLSYYKIVQS